MVLLEKMMGDKNGGMGRKWRDEPLYLKKYIIESNNNVITWVNIGTVLKLLLVMSVSPLSEPGWHPSFSA